MNSYITKPGQNIFDIALTLYGSIEGIFDLLVSNPTLSLETDIKAGTSLNYHDTFVINSDVVSWFDANNITVKNSCKEIKHTSVEDEIKEWVDNNIQTITSKYQNNELTVEIPSEKVEESEDVPMLMSLGSDQSEEVADSDFSQEEEAQESQNKAEVNEVVNAIKPLIPTYQNSKQEIAEIMGVDKSVEESVLEANIKTLYISGYVAVPTNDLDRIMFYKDVSRPKMIIEHAGTTCKIRCKLSLGKFIAIDWGDNINLDFYHSTDEELEIIHTYRDSDVHNIKIYGTPEFTLLDLTELNGIYYPTSEIPVSEFITPYPTATELNKLFIQKK